MSIVTAVAATVVLNAMGEGLVHEFSSLAGGMEAHLVGTTSGAAVDLGKVDEHLVHRIAMMPDIRAAEGFLIGYTVMEESSLFTVFGYQPRGRAIQGYHIAEGRPLATNHQIILGRVAARNLGLGVGQTLRILHSTFRIVGIFETGTLLKDSGAVISLRDAQRLFGRPHKVGFVSIWLHNAQQAASVRQQVEERFPEMTIAQTSEFAEDLADIRMVRAGTWSIALVALIVSGLAMTNAMVMSVFERTREIGVLRALGWGRQRLLSMIVRESLMLSLLGGAGGVGTAMVLSWLLDLAPIVRGLVRPRYSAGSLVQALLMATALGVIGGLLPAWRAVRLQPVDALRYE
jgi:ABC-type lipoprotein release transport system permease subunit